MRAAKQNSVEFAPFDGAMPWMPWMPCLLAKDDGTEERFN